MKRLKRNIVFFVILLVLAGTAALITYHYDSIFKPKWEIVDKLDGNIFPSVILSLATTNSVIIDPVDTAALGNQKSRFAIKIENPKENSVVRIELNESPFYSTSVTEFELKEKGKIYYLYPNVIWKYENLQEVEQPRPVDVSFHVTVNDQDLGTESRTFSVRSINECLLGYKDAKGYHSTDIFFAAYVNEDHPMIDKILREALDARIVRLFQGYQGNNPETVKKQVYAIWYALQKRNFKYSSISKTSLSSDVVYSQRVRTVGNSLETSQINCLDGTVLFASFLRAINIDPIIVRIPGHVFVGFYLDKDHKEKMFLETNLIGNIDLDDYLSQEQYDEALVYEKDSIALADLNDALDSTQITIKKEKLKTQTEMSKKLFDLAIEDGGKKYEKYKEYFGTNKPNYMFLDINNETRKIIQPIGK